MILEILSNTAQPKGTHPCPYDDVPARLVSDARRANRPSLDAGGRLQYYCLHCHLRFTVDARGEVYMGQRDARG